MLVLSRKRGEQIVLGDDITVTVVEISGNRIKIGIEAPPYVRIVRGELNALESRRLLPAVCAVDEEAEDAGMLVGNPR